MGTQVEMKEKGKEEREGEGEGEGERNLPEFSVVEKLPTGEERLTSVFPGNERKPSGIEDLLKFKQDPTSDKFSVLDKKTKKFYLSQNRTIQDIEDMEKVLGTSSIPEDSSKNKKREKFAIYFSFAVNIVLVISLVLAVVFSGAIALIASVVDSSLDIFSAVIMVATNRAKNRVDYYKYPQGKERLEPAGILVFSAVMGTSSLLLIIESIKRLISDPLLKPELSFISIGFVCGDIVTKSCLFTLCYYFGKTSPSVRALAQDHRNDVILNSVALLTAFLGSKYWGPLDSIGAILISLWTMFNWGSSCLEQVQMLTGKAADPEFLKTLAWLCCHHHPAITAIETLRAFHFGTRYLVEVDIVLPRRMTLEEAHDISESLQQKIELLPEVERAFVHPDFEVEHDPKTEHKRW